MGRIIGWGVQRSLCQRHGSRDGLLEERVRREPLADFPERTRKRVGRLEDAGEGRRK